MRKWFLLLCIFPLMGFAQDTAQSYMQEIARYRAEQNAEFANPEESPLKEEDLASFKELPFYPVDTQFRVSAHFVRTEGEKPFEMATTTSRKPIYEKYGEAHFKINGQPFVLNVYQSHRLMGVEEYKNYLFLPFTDLTNGQGSYGGGRFLDMEIPEGDTLIIDFNKAYNPLCYYNDRYSCPIPPAENHLEVEITAGVKADH